MKTRVLLVIASGAILMSAAAPAENYYVRNRPFTQVVKAGGDALVGAEAFLRALGMNWTVNGNVVTLTDAPASNPTLGSGPLTFKYGSKEVVLEGSPRGGTTYVPLRPLASLAQYGVSANPFSGTVDVAKARFASDTEKKLVGDASAEREAEKKSKEEAWAKKAAALKEKREAAAKTGDEAKTGEEAKDEPKDGDKPADKPADKPDDGKKPKDDAKTPPVTTPPAATPDVKPDEKKEPVKEARLEVFKTDASPSPADGTVTITCEVKNMGDAPSKSVSGVLTLTGPGAGGAVTDNTNVVKKVWMTKSISGPSVQPGASWQFSEKYRHPSGNAMPMGNINAEFKLNSVK